MGGVGCANSPGDTLWSQRAIQRWLVSEADLSYAKAMEIASPKRVIGAIELATVPVHANSKRPPAMHVERRATLLQPADLRVRIPQSLPSKAMGSSTVLTNLVPQRPQLRRTPAVMSTTCTSWVRNPLILSKCHS